jgi:hypothetical protein
MSYGLLNFTHRPAMTRGGGGSHTAVLQFADRIGYIYRAAILGKHRIETFKAE